MLPIVRSPKVIGYNNRGQYHDDTPITKATQSTSKIVRINFQFGVAIHYYQVIWDTHNGPLRGKPSAERECSTLRLSVGEFITRVDGTTTGSWDSDRTFTSLCFHTNLGVIKRFGTAEGEEFAFDADEGLDQDKESRMGLISFETWILDGTILALRPTFAEYPIDSTTSSNDERGLKYECVANVQSGSSFQQHLASPTIELHIGTAPHTITLHVREDTLCKLPFFTAALHGGFKEATEKSISMPEDSPDVISALIEFLATDSYTYAYKARPINKEAEVSFHLDLFAAAKKYGAEDLMDEAKHNFVEALNAVGDCTAGNRLSLWRQAYDVGLRAKDNWDTGERMYMFRKGMVRQVRTVLAECQGEFDAAVREVEWFGLDFIGISLGFPEDG